MSFVVAIDGPAGSGKGTVTKLIAERLGFVTIDTGAMYRCVTVQALRNNILASETEKIEEMMKDISIDMKKENGVQKVFLNGEDVTKEIRTPIVDKNVSAFSALPIVRNKITPMQRKMGQNGNVIMEGRDIGTVVFPVARRRYKQNLERGIDVTYEQVLEDIKRRNELDSHREVAPLKKAEDAVYLDSTSLSIEQVVEKIIGIIQNKLK